MMSRATKEYDACAPRVKACSADVCCEFHISHFGICYEKQMIVFDIFYEGK